MHMGKKVRQHPQPIVLTFFGMKLHSEYIADRNRHGDLASAELSGSRRRRIIRRDEVIAVNMVKATTRVIRKQRTRARRLNVAPTDIGDAVAGFSRLQALDPACHQTQALVLAIFGTARGQELHPQADTEHRNTAPRGCPNRCRQGLGLEARHAIAECAHARQQDRIGAGHIIRRGDLMIPGAYQTQGMEFTFVPQLDQQLTRAARDGLSLAEAGSYDLILLDVMLPGLDGYTFAKRLRAQQNQTPILMLTARDASPDIIQGLDLGADDYLTKPFSFDVLFARVRAVSRRGPIPRPVCLQVEDLTLNQGTREVRRGQRRISLTRTEYSILEMLMRCAGRVISRDSLIENVWAGASGIESNTLDAFVRLLRAKVELPGETKLIQTVRGVGYSLRVGE